MIGRTISHYKIVDKLGEGGMGSVWKAEDTTLGRLVALKALSKQLAENEEAKARFVREAQAASSLNHANITTVHELLEDEGEQFIVMEYVEGKTIRDIVESSHVSIRKAVDIIIQAAEALEAAHNKGILHRDVKSANIMVSMEGNVKVMDFGLAHLEERSQLTRTGTMMGTLAYSSPEQLTGAPVDRRGEIFSLGCVFYELLTGQPPFKSPSEGELVFEIINTEQDRPSKLREDIPEKIEAVITRMLEKKPELRYQSCGELLADLKAIHSELETTTVEVSTYLAAVTAKRKKVLAFSAVAAVLIIGAAAVFLTRKGGPELDPNRVVVTVFNNRTQDQSLDPVGEWIAGYITSAIDQSELMNVIPSDHSANASRIWRERAAQGEIADPIQALAEEVFAGIAISGDYYLLDGDNLQFQVRIRDIRLDEVIEELDPIQGPLGERDDVVGQLRQKILSVLAVKCNPDFEQFAHSISQPASFDAFLQFKEGLDFYFGRLGAGSLDHYTRAIPHFLKAFEIDSSYVTSLIWAARSAAVYSTHFSSYCGTADSLASIAELYREQMTTFEQLQLDATKGMILGDSIDNLSTLRRIVDRFPGTFWTFDAAQTAVRANRPYEALEYFALIDPNSTAMQQPSYWYNQKCYAHVILEDFQGLLDNVYTAREVLGRPNWNRDEEAHALGGLGELHEILEILTVLHDLGIDNWRSFYRAACQLKKQGHHAAFHELIDWYEEYMSSRPEQEKLSRTYRYRLSTVYFLSDRFNEAYNLLKILNTENPREYNGLLGMAAARIGNQEEARYQITSVENSFNEKYERGDICYLQAAILAHLGEIDDAISLLKEAIKYSGIIFSVYAEADLEPLWDTPAYQELVSPKG